MTVLFDDSDDKKIKELRENEEEDLVKILAEENYHMQSINLAGVAIENEALRSISEADARKFEIGPFKILGKHLHIAIISPKKEIMDEVNSIFEKEGYISHFYLASHTSVQKVWSRYKELSLAEASKEGGIDITENTLLVLGNNIKGSGDIKKFLDEAMATGQKTSRMLEIILAGALAIEASDIHIEPEEHATRLRYRLDGVLQDVTDIGSDRYHFINSRIKLLSGLKLTQTGQAQDGRFSIFIKGEEIGIRTSIIPSAYGEGIVMRILNPKITKVKFESLGIEPKLFEILDHEIKKPNGLMLITGPTGSGKTTTLYSFLRRIYNPEIKIITIEDPIEYHLPGITQTQTESDKGYNFAAGLRAAMRQDPDVVMVGEIRDGETASIAIDAALTGHLVFSTIHTNNAQGVIPRLIDLGINPKILTSALTISVAQRLVRILCPNCKAERLANEKEVATFKRIISEAIEEGKEMKSYGVEVQDSYKVCDAVGCEKCNFTGYKGRIGIFEAILTDEAIEKIVNENPSEREIKKVAEKQHLLDMKEDSVVKILKGITSLDEATSVVDFDED